MTASSSRICAALVLCAAAGRALAFASDEDGRETSIASTRRRQVRETPGIVTVLTRDDLVESGARDLADVLARVPGFQFGVDVANGIGPGFRGLWGQEGKVLFILDGIEMNDLSYGTFLLGHRLPVEQLERVEVIRGPGSALYGGNAELAVVRVLTRASTVNGVAGGLAAGRLGPGAGGGELTAAGGGTEGGVRMGLSGSVASNLTSDRTYVDSAGTAVDLARSSRITTGTVTAHAAWRGVELRALFDEYAVGGQDGYAAAAPRDVTVQFRTAAADARATIPLGVEGLSLVPQVTYRWEQPYRSPTPDLPDFYYDVTNQRLTARVVAIWDTLVGPSLVLGTEAYWQRGVVNDFSLGLQSFQGKSRITFSDVAAFAEAGIDTEWANLLAGARVEHQSSFGTAFVPRLAVTRLFAPFHVKVLASGAYRAPSTENVNLEATTIRPERTTVLEAEVGWQISELAYVSANVFDVTIRDPIVFAFDGAETYSNLDRTGSRGAEAEVVLGRGPAVLSASYSFYTAAGKNEVPAYAVAGSRALLVGFAGHKVVATAKLRPDRSVLVVPALTFLSPRAAYDGTEAAGAPAAGRVGARTTFDLFVAWQDVGAQGLELGAGVKDLFDQGVPLVQPYPGGHEPLPAGGREVWLRLRWPTR